MITLTKEIQAATPTIALELKCKPIFTVCCFYNIDFRKVK